MLANYRNLFLGLDEAIKLNNGRWTKYVNFDNAATTPPFRCVLENIRDFAPCYSSVHRGAGVKSEICSSLYENGREVILKFFNASSLKYDVIFVKNTTEGINKLACRLIGSKKDKVLSTLMEHHSNDLPWRERCDLDYVNIDSKGKLDLDNLEEKLHKGRGEIKFLTLTGASNVTGYINDIHGIARLCHNHGAKIIVDGAQLVPHKTINLQGGNEEESIDFLVFSAHKMYAPFGTGVIIAKKDSFVDGMPECRGGGTVKVVTLDKVIWDEEPFKDEAGTPNIMGVVALLSAIRQINYIGMSNIEMVERELTQYLLNNLKRLNFINVYGREDFEEDRLGIVTFNMRGLYHEILSEELSKKYGISVRNGCFCAQPYAQRLLGIDKSEIDRYVKNPDLKKPGMVRASFGLYNTLEEINAFIEALERIYKSNGL